MRIQSNQLSDIRHFYVSELRGLYVEEEALSLFYWAAEEILKIKQNKIKTSINSLRLSESELLVFFNTCKRLRKGEPIQYIFSKAYFDDISLYVAPGVLIPRPETEEMLSYVVKEINTLLLRQKKFGSNRSIRVWDAGTGSACLSIAIAKRFPEVEVWGSDISEEALAIATQNKNLFQGDKKLLNLNLIKHDLLKDECLPGKWDIIVSNPPYICESEKVYMHKNVLSFEPSSALFVSDADPLIFYRAIGNFAKSALNSDGVLWAEINENKPKEIYDLYKSQEFSKIEILEDFRAKARFVRLSI